MTITKQHVAGKIAAYLHHEIALDDLVDWSEQALMEGEFDERGSALLARVVARLGVADVRAFGLAWEDGEEILAELGFVPHVELVSASRQDPHSGRARSPDLPSHTVLKVSPNFGVGFKILPEPFFPGLQSSAGVRSGTG